MDWELIAVAGTALAAPVQAVLAGYFVSKKQYGWATSTAIGAILSMMMFCTTLIQGAIDYAA